jgi:hypothetical protein
MPHGPRQINAARKGWDKHFKDNQEFCAVDGEGGNVPEDGALFGVRHQYLSLRVGADLLETGRPLSWLDCFGFLADQPPSRQYVAYFFDYDVTMMIRTLPEQVARKLLNRGSRMNFAGNCLPVTYEGFQFDYMPHKEFRIRRLGGKWVTINDVGQFFQSSFLKTLEKWNIGTPEEREMIRKGKSMRAEFTENTDEIRAYNALECVLLRDLMEHFRAVCFETGYVPKKWQGPGYLASAMLQYHGVPRREDIPILQNKDFRRLAQAGYYGGRFETTAAGPISTPIWQYDINSAYPHVLTTLPCLTHGSWRRVAERPNGGLWIGKVHFDHSAPRRLYNLPFRLINGNIQYPKEGIGVYWSTELAAAERAGTNFQFLEGWEYEPHCTCKWFDFVYPYYQQRLALGKSSKGFVLKLAGNSIYGKLAQSIGYAPWANPVWAGLITAGCRAKLIDAYSQAPDKCYMLATDGIFMGTKLDLPISNQLGEWEETYHPDGLFIVQPGIYFIGAEAKSRGVERGRVDDLRPLFEKQWESFISSHGEDHTVGIPVQNFITAKQALVRGKWHLAGTWETADRQLSFIWQIKRKSGIGFWEDGVMRTVPHDGLPGLESTPYGRDIGGGLRVPDEQRYQDAGLIEKQRMEEQPDWVQSPLAGMGEVE